MTSGHGGGTSGPWGNPDPRPNSAGCARGQRSDHDYSNRVRCRLGSSWGRGLGMAHPGGTLACHSADRPCWQTTSAVRDLAPKYHSLPCSSIGQSERCARNQRCTRRCGHQWTATENVNAGAPNELSVAFVAIAEQRPDALLVGSDPFLVNRRELLVSSWRA